MSDTLQNAQRLAAEGSPRLALDVVENSQPRDVGAPRWVEWEALRCSLLVRLVRQRELLDRAERLPSGAEAPALRECLLPATRAALGAGQGALARRHAARLLWSGTGSADDVREVRLLVIESHVLDRRSEDAYRSMLRFDLDYRPVERRTAARFVAALLDLGMAKEAVNWLGSLDDADPVKLALRLQARLIEPEAAIRLARASLAKSPAAGWWGVIADAAELQRNRALRAEALEQRLQHSTTGDSSLTARVRELWEMYVALARDAASRNHLLDNDDTGWGAFAASRIRSDPIMARAVFAHLARGASTPEARSNAQLQLELSLQIAKLDAAALRLFSDGPIAVAALDPRLRHSLGTVAESRGLHAAAVRMWQGLPPPAGQSELEWQLRIASAMMRAGETEAGAALAKQIAGTNDAWPPEMIKRAAAFSRDLLSAGHAAAAQALLAALVQRTGGMEHRQLLFDLGRAHEIGGRGLVAAEHYLRCAALVEPKPPDALARQARLAAGLSLSRAGYRDDARAQFEWVTRNSRDPAQLEVARRELQRP